MSCRTGAERLVLDGLAGRLLGAEGKVAWILATSASSRRIESASVLIRALSVGRTFVRLDTSGCGIADHSGGTTTLERSEFVEADHRQRADGHGGVDALVDVGATLRRFDEALGARALTADAKFAILAVVVDVTSGLANLVDANFSLKAIFVRVAKLEAKTTVTLFTSGTVSVKGAAWHAEASVTGLTSRANVSCSTNFWNPHTSFASSWHTCKTRWTLAGFSLVLGSANCIGSAGLSQ
jgi:hypothetical protein